MMIFIREIINKEITDFCSVYLEDILLKNISKVHIGLLKTSSLVFEYRKYDRFFHIEINNLKRIYSVNLYEEWMDRQLIIKKGLEVYTGVIKEVSINYNSGIFLIKGLIEKDK